MTHVLVAVEKNTRNAVEDRFTFTPQGLAKKCR